ncbi:hypothetical protein NDS46_25070 [Paenibacillus thiaminolyticus]|uniref:hypothetical protein n=1 Tax=Paenibacillus thiaminolyticus TaxID=49283 RepID=UPI00232AB2FF|nr:hypothetical protein [Paenibacillus thiaminolyticus]WCF07544.1 hypothetical protein NDS46_25070 [Paenibacillus thiaminolyticus]
MIITIVVCLVILSPWLLSTEKTAAIVTLIQINQNSIRIEDRDNNQITVYGREEIIRTLQVNKNYYIQYESRWFTRPTLVSIKLMPDDV